MWTIIFLHRATKPSLIWTHFTIIGWTYITMIIIHNHFSLTIWATYFIYLYLTFLPMGARKHLTTSFSHSSFYLQNLVTTEVTQQFMSELGFEPESHRSLVKHSQTTLILILDTGHTELDQQTVSKNKTIIKEGTIWNIRPSDILKMKWLNKMNFLLEKIHSYSTSK